MAADRAATMTNTVLAFAAGGSGPSMPDRSATIPRPALPGNAASLSAQPQRPASRETLRLYALDWAAFEDWCGKHGRMTMPAETASVVAFLAEGATTLSAGALTRRAAAIAAKHRQSGLASPTADPTVTAILREARGSATPRRAPRKTPATLTRMAARCPRDLAGMRDRALLLLAASGLGRAALVGLDVEHIRFTRTAAELFSDAVSPAGRAGEDEGRGAVVIGRGPDPLSARFRRCVTGSTHPTRYLARCFGKSTAGARSSIIGSALMRSAGSWPGGACGVHDPRPVTVGRTREEPDDPSVHCNGSPCRRQSDSGGGQPDGMVTRPTRRA